VTEAGAEVGPSEAAAAETETDGPVRWGAGAGRGEGDERHEPDERGHERGDQRGAGDVSDGDGDTTEPKERVPVGG
jgi:hypothetical protein